MKRMIFLFVLILSFLACSNNDDENNENQSIIGTWQLVEEFYGNVSGQGQWTEVENGYTYTFTKQNSVISNRYPCKEGTYSLNNGNNITLKFDCPETGVIILGYDISFENNYLILTPNPLPCDEGCKFKYKKIKE